MDDDFELAAALLEAPPDWGDPNVEFPDGGDGQEDALFELASGLVERPLRQRLGFKKQSPASIAYARKCLEAKRATQKKDAAEQKLKTLIDRIRRPVQSHWRRFEVRASLLTSCARLV